jgi:hypothetical protein
MTASIAVFNPEASGKPARVTLYQFKPQSEVEVEGILNVAITVIIIIIIIIIIMNMFYLSGPGNSRTMFAATDATLLWNSTGYIIYFQFCKFILFNNL